MRDALFHLRDYPNECLGTVVQNEGPWELAVFHGARCVAVIALAPVEYNRLRNAFGVPQRLHPLPLLRQALQTGR
ncbi:MAG TPA: hypothetical protein VF629_03625 [Hymenobacter sp.]|jgi:hypothetical protein|uniref:hypothetical protein n=1 Tax=Hymenobacter sp. TaxID=1898978 RepID=UPI002ED82A7C